MSMMIGDDDVDDDDDDDNGDDNDDDGGGDDDDGDIDNDDDDEDVVFDDDDDNDKDNFPFGNVCHGNSAYLRNQSAERVLLIWPAKRIFLSSCSPRLLSENYSSFIIYGIY